MPKEVAAVTEGATSDQESGLGHVAFPRSPGRRPLRSGPKMPTAERSQRLTGYGAARRCDGQELLGRVMVVRRAVVVSAIGDG